MRRAGLGGRVVKGTTTEHPARFLGNGSARDLVVSGVLLGRTRGVGKWPVLFPAAAVVTPLPEIAQHIEQPVLVGQKLTDRPGPIERVQPGPAVARKELVGNSERAWRDGARTAEKLPLRFGGQTVPCALDRPLRQDHALVDVVEIAPLFLGNMILGAQPVAIPGGIEPEHAIDGAFQTVGEAIVWTTERVERAKLLDGHLLGGNRDRAVDPSKMQLLLEKPTVFVRGRTHPENQRAGHDGEGMPVGTDLPARAIRVRGLEAWPLPILCNRFVAAPAMDQELGGRVDAGV